MKKSLFFYAMAACVAISNVSCGGDDDLSGLPPEGTVLTLPVPETASQAAAYVFETNTANAVKAEAGDIILKGINFTESGKAVIEVLSNGSAKFVTYNAVLDNGAYTLTDDSGKKIGTVTDNTLRGTTGTSLNIEITITVPGIGVITFRPESPAAVQKVVETIAATTATTNVCRTWTVAQMNITLDGEVDLAMTENSGNLKRFADEAQKQGANLTDDEMAQLNKTFKGISLDKNGLFAIEYYENSDKIVSSEACSWSWTNEAAQMLQLKMRDGSDFGNKFLTDKTAIKVDFNPTGATFTLNTEIKGSKNYKATLTIVMI
jgi:hypothetical protein